MPLYRYQCPKDGCDTVYDDVYFSLADHVEKPFDWCPRHGHQNFEQVMTAPATWDWGNEGTEGRYFEHLSHDGMRFRDKRSYDKHLRDNHLVELGKKPGMPGCEI